MQKKKFENDAHAAEEMNEKKNHKNFIPFQTLVRCDERKKRKPFNSCLMPGSCVLMKMDIRALEREKSEKSALV